MPHDEFSPVDPMELVGMAIPGEEGTLEAMAEAIVDEYVRLGWDEPRLMALFANSVFLATHRIYLQRGEGFVRDLIRATRARYTFHAAGKERRHG